MNAAEFLDTHASASRSIEAVVDRWVAEKKVDEFLAGEITGGLTVGQALLESGSAAGLPSEMRDDLTELWEGDFGTLRELRDRLVERVARGDGSAEELLVELQGRIGELRFERASGGAARLSDNPVKDGYDVVVGRGEDARHLQVRVYRSADDAVREIRDVNERVREGKIRGRDGAPVETVEFAVNSDIHRKVVEKAGELGLDNRIHDLGATRRDFRELWKAGVDDVTPELREFFGDLCGGGASVAMVHGMAHGFMAWKGTKGWEQAAEDAVYDVASSAIGASAACVADAVLFVKLEAALGVLGGAVAGVFWLGVGFGAQNLAHRFFDRRFLLKRLVAGNRRLATLYLRFTSPHAATG